ncbi:DUF2608 domain-containing protein [Alteromonas sp. C1M14]|uniref:DUF2608 domain-containing protein n=1 Tax=Alteromonas sp. C1M14 TaxID=2841567 RepID=UPI001C0A4B12|nr:DUF2608 domain-containing protein [Alteromonas sp. C1M14]MBU2978126.1 DUF2608 domain-containing protein [Alteromonas sp. C1M14]
MNYRPLLFLFTLLSFTSLTACTSVSERQELLPPTTNVTVEDVRSFAAVNEQITALNNLYGAENVLVVSDIDNTLLTSTSDLGGDIWYQWQRGKLPLKPSPEQTVNCLFEDAIGLLYELNPMVLTEPDLHHMVAQWQQQGNAVIALTSRSPKYRTATERELYRNGFDLATTAIKETDLPSDSLTVYRQTLAREMSYSRGIMMTTGMNKGTMLHWLLAQTGQTYQAIVFIDDSKKNIDDMNTSWQGDTVPMHIFYYTRVEHERISANGSVLTAQQADKMARDYQTLTTTLQQVFPARPAQQCLSVQ